MVAVEVAVGVAVGTLVGPNVGAAAVGMSVWAPPVSGPLFSEPPFSGARVPGLPVSAVRVPAVRRQGLGGAYSPVLPIQVR